MLALVVLISAGSCMTGINAFFEQERTPVHKFTLMQGDPVRPAGDRRNRNHG